MWYCITVFAVDDCMGHHGLAYNNLTESEFLELVRLANQSGHRVEVDWAAESPYPEDD